MFDFPNRSRLYNTLLKHGETKQPDEVKFLRPWKRNRTSCCPSTQLAKQCARLLHAHTHTYSNTVVKSAYSVSATSIYPKIDLTLRGKIFCWPVITVYCHCTIQANVSKPSSSLNLSSAGSTKCDDLEELIQQQTLATFTDDLQTVSGRKANAFVGESIDRTLLVLMRLRARALLKIYWRSPGEACPPVKNHRSGIYYENRQLTHESLSRSHCTKLTTVACHPSLAERCAVTVADL